MTEQGKSMAESSPVCMAHTGVLENHTGLDKRITESHDANVRWREDHERRNNDTFDRVFAELKEDRIENKARWDNLSKRLPIWTTFLISALFMLLGSAMTVIVMLSNQVLK